MLKSIKRRLSSGHTHKCLVGIVEATWAGAAMGEGAATGQGSEGRGLEGRGSKGPVAAAFSRSRRCWPRPERKLRYGSNFLTSAQYFSPCSVHILKAQTWMCAKKEKTYPTLLCPAWTTEPLSCPSRATEPMVGFHVVRWQLWEQAVIVLVKTTSRRCKRCPTPIFLLQLSSRPHYCPTLSPLSTFCWIVVL